MFKKIKEWWTNFRKFTPPKETKTMRDEELMEELRKCYDMAYVFERPMSRIERFRMDLLFDVLDKRGYDCIGGAAGMSFIKRK